MQAMTTSLAIPTGPTTHDSDVHARTGGLVGRRLTASIGVELEGVDLGAGIEASVVDALRSAVAEHHVVFLRGQHLSAEQHETLARAFGPIQASPVQLAAGRHGVSAPVSTIEDTAARPPAGFPWHTDVSWTSDPPAFGFLSAVVIPEFGGDTIWASTGAIYDALTAEDQQRCAASTVVHAPDASLLASVERHHGRTVADRLRRQHPGIEHPLVQTHPLTGRRSLFLCPLYARRIIGPDGADGRLLAQLHAMLDDPHVQVRWRWQAGDLVVWDETSTCHRALSDHYPQRRVMRRCVTARTT
jgi:alpha-ketoglutarate-dependent taurine dioxygenase